MWTIVIERPPCAEVLVQTKCNNTADWPGDLVCSHREVANEVTACRFRKQSNPALTASKSSDDPPRGPRTAQKRERSRLGRPFDFRLHRARRCAKLIRCVSIFARKPANVTQRAAKPISITARSSNIPKSSDSSADPVKDLAAARDPAPRGERQVQQGKKNEADVYIATGNLSWDPPRASYERIPGTPRGFQPRYSYITHLPRPLNRKLKSVQLFKYRLIIKLPRERASELVKSALAKLLARLLPRNNVYTSGPRFLTHSFYVSGLRGNKASKLLT